MKALEFNDNKLNITDYPMPTLNNNEALIKVSMVGICNTDIEITKGYMGFSGILGHEFAGTIEKINGEDQSLLNKRVVGEINCACNSCEYCKENLKTHCPNRKTLGIFNKDGCFAEYVNVPLENLHEIQDSVADEEAVFVEPLAAAFEIMDQVYLKPTDKIAVFLEIKIRPS
jgi:threonine dehydrogenase-like Zn-dependent dehydrogenase